MEKIEQEESRVCWEEVAFINVKLGEKKTIEERLERVGAKTVRVSEEQVFHPEILDCARS
jgi:hypothetical protein